jgi:hypothetical protein
MVFEYARRRGCYRERLTIALVDRRTRPPRQAPLTQGPGAVGASFIAVETTSATELDRITKAGVRTIGCGGFRDARKWAGPRVEPGGR